MSSTHTTSSTVDHTVVISQETVDDLAARLRAARLPHVPGDAAQHGVPLATIERLLTRWRDAFDWAVVQARMNSFPQVMHRSTDGARLFAVRVRGNGTGVPVVVLHGWADTFYSQLPLAERLATAGHDVVVPSLPGFAFSDHAPGPATAQASATAVHEMMTGLGYERYAVHGGDWGGAVAHALMTKHPEAIVAAHLTDIPFYLHFFTERENLLPHERAFLDAAEARQEEPQYYRLQAGRPLTLSYAMADSPVALLAWLTGLYTAWTDQDLNEDAVLANASLYWLTNTFHSSVRFYSEGTDDWDDNRSEPAGWGDDGNEPAGWGDDTDQAQWSEPSPAVPTAFAIHPADIVIPTRSYAERYFTVEGSAS